MTSPASIPAPAVESLFGVSFHGPALLRADEAAKAFGAWDRSTIYQLVETGELEAHRNPKLRKSHFRITRRSVLARLALRATRPLPELPALLLHLASTLSPAQRARFVAKLEVPTR